MKVTHNKHVIPAILDVRKQLLEMPFTPSVAHAILRCHSAINGNVHATVRYHRHRGEVAHIAFMDEPLKPTGAKKPAGKKP